MDIAAHDVDANPLVSFTFSEAQQSWCRDNKIDPEDPRCSRVHLFGKVRYILITCRRRKPLALKLLLDQGR